MLLLLIFAVAILINYFISNEVGKIANTKQLGYSKGFWFSFLFSPLLGLLFVIASQPLDSVEQMKLEEPRKKSETNEGLSIYATIGLIVLLTFVVAGIIISNTSDHTTENYRISPSNQQYDIITKDNLLREIESNQLKFDLRNAKIKELQTKHKKIDSELRKSIKINDTVHDTIHYTIF